MMADPMGGMGAPQEAPTDENATEFFDPLVLQLNLAKIDRIRGVMGIASGCAAGILGLTGLEGLGTFYFSTFSSLLVCFVFFHLLVSLVVWIWNMKADLRSYTRQSWMKYMLNSIQQTGLSFTLFWTLFYGLVYLY